jgi:hypothetical protein
MDNETLEQKIIYLEHRVNQLEIQILKLTNGSEDLFIKKIIELLNEKRFSGSAKYRYSYSEIGKLTGTSPSFVCKIAKKNNINRRLKKYD